MLEKRNGHTNRVDVGVFGKVRVVCVGGGLDVLWTHGWRRVQSNGRTQMRRWVSSLWLRGFRGGLRRCPVFCPGPSIRQDGARLDGACIDGPRPLGFGIVWEGREGEPLRAPPPPPPSPETESIFVCRVLVPSRLRSVSFELHVVGLAPAPRPAGGLASIRAASSPPTGLCIAGTPFRRSPPPI